MEAAEIHGCESLWKEDGADGETRTHHGVPGLAGGRILPEPWSECHRVFVPKVFPAPESVAVEKQPKPARPGLSVDFMLTHKNGVILVIYFQNSLKTLFDQGVRRPPKGNLLVILR
ncbi:hypothetical protein ACQCLI_07400 [Pseudomonas nitroreducens]|uniref:hypothetical protein n=1 Tax=Pseudomonas nitroreducens TaxID=46680 RepID=UPI0012FD1CF4|nr:hypothetical protein [Pseudomonas nitroreducens]